MAIKSGSNIRTLSKEQFGQKIFRIKITKAGKGRFYISKDSVNNIISSKLLNKNDLIPFRINRISFKAKPRKDGRIEIPSYIVKKGRIRTGFERSSYYKEKRFSQSYVLRPKQFSGEIFFGYEIDPYDDKYLEAIKRNVSNSIKMSLVKISSRYSSYSSEINFVIETENDFGLFLNSFSGTLRDFRENPLKVRKKIDKFVDESVDRVSSFVELSSYIIGASLMSVKIKAS